VKDRERIVVDTNVFVSRLLLPESVPGRAVREAVELGTVLVSEATLKELSSVLGRGKFDRYVSKQDRERFMFLLSRIATRICSCWLRFGA
jgi:predicted nucleic acid-binding protein